MANGQQQIVEHGNTINDVVRKPSAAINISLDFTRLERQLLNFLIFHAQSTTSVSDKRQSVPYSQVCDVIGWSSRNPEPVKEALLTLGNPIHWNEHGIDRTTKWTMCSFVQYAELHDGFLTYALNSLIVEKINRPILFAKLALVVQKKFKSVHSIALWEWLTDELCRNGTDNSNLTLSLTELHQLFGLSGTTYSENYKYLKRDVVDKAVKEVNTHSDLTVSVTPERAGRKVAALIFDVQKKKSVPQLQIEFEGLSAGAKDHRPQSRSLIKELESYGVQTHIARKLVRDYAPDRVRSNIDYTNGQRVNSNKPGYLVKAITENFSQQVGADTPEDQTASAEPPSKSVTEDDFQVFKQRQVRTAFEKLSDTDKRDLLEEFYDKAEAGEVPGLEGWTRKSKRNKPMVEGLFFSTVASRFLTQSHETNFNDFVEWSGESG